MTLELGKVRDQIEEMGNVLAARAVRHREALPHAQQLLELYAGDLEELRRVALSEPGKKMRCAIPGDERLDTRRAPGPMPAGATLIAADGSQIYPDRHGLAYYYILNVGTIVYRHGSSQAPCTSTWPDLCYTDEKVYPDGEPVSSDLVNTERNVAELKHLTALVLAEPACDTACLGLTDGPLLLWLGQTAVSAGEQHRLREEYLGCLDQLRGSAAIVAGFVSRPQSAEVLSLLYLRHLPEEQRGPAKDLHGTQYQGLADRHLFRGLAPGERSALFARGTPENAQYALRGHQIHFFYVNTGNDVARVEVPEWVAARGEALALVHAAVVNQCSFNNGYPYILTRADELAVIQGEERQTLETMLMQAMLRQGLPLPELSRKAEQKQAARWRRPH